MTPGRGWEICKKRYWTATGVIPRWQLVSIYALIVAAGAVGISKSVDTARRASDAVRQIQEQRISLCNDQDRRHDNTIAQLQVLSNQQSKQPQSIILNTGHGPEHATITFSSQNTKGTIALIDALVPRRNCQALHLPPAPDIK